MEAYTENEHARALDRLAADVEGAKGAHIASEMALMLVTVLIRLDLEAAEHPGKVFICAALREPIRELLTRAKAVTL